MVNLTLWRILALSGVAGVATPVMAQTGVRGAPAAPPTKLLATVSTTPADDDAAFSADRPGFTEPPDVLRRGVIQLEGGEVFGVESRPAAVEYNFVEGSPLLRLGVGRRTELRFTGEGFRFWKNEYVEGVERARGMSDFSIGAKLKLREEDGLLPAIAILPALSLPIGHHQFSSSTLDPAIKLAWAKTLVHGFSTGGNFNLSWVTDQDRRLLQRAYSLSLGHNLPGRLGGYWEVYRISPTEAGSTWMFNTGVTRSMGHNAQVDIEVGRTLKPSAPCWFVAAGFAVRLPSGPLRRSGI